MPQPTIALSDYYKIYVDGAQPATLNDGAGVLTDYPTLQEAHAWFPFPQPTLRNIIAAALAS